MTKHEPERRFMAASAPTATGRKISGYAAKFNTRSQNLGSAESPFFEIIKPGAFDGVLNDDVRALVNHDASLILARSKNGKGSLKLSVDSVGLRYEFEAPNTQAGADLLESIKRGDLDQSSFSFICDPSGSTYTKEGKATVRTISKFAQLLDVSPVTFPAYADTTVAARAAGHVPAVVAHKPAPSAADILARLRESDEKHRRALVALDTAVALACRDKLPTAADHRAKLRKSEESNRTLTTKLARLQSDI